MNRSDHRLFCVKCTESVMHVYLGIDLNNEAEYICGICDTRTTPDKSIYNAEEFYREGTEATSFGTALPIIATNAIKKPPHYTSLTPEPGPVIDSWNLGWFVSNAIKYLVRAHSKGDQLNDLLKAKRYVEMEIKKLDPMEPSETGIIFTATPIVDPEIEAMKAENLKKKEEA